jgi:hypothetical protein
MLLYPEGVERVQPGVSYVFSALIVLVLVLGRLEAAVPGWKRDEWRKASGGRFAWVRKTDEDEGRRREA